MLDKIIKFSFYLLFFLTPLVWTPLNFELFEYNKMMFVYLLTVIVTSCWILKMTTQKKLLIKRTPLDIPILLFLFSQILSTIFSIDIHTSIFGYYSRSNGGLLSIISYILLYYGFVSNIDKKLSLQFLKAGLLGGLFVALWAIPEHFGVSPSCVILRGSFTADCWIQDVQARVFATLGQPNWLAAYLGMLIFPSLYLVLTTKNPKYYLLTIIFYLAFTFTYSRGATLGLIGSLAVFLIFLFFERKREVTSKNIKVLKETSRHFVPQRILIVLGSFLAVNLLFGSALTRFQLTDLMPKQPSTQNPNPTTQVSTGLTQLENGGTESGQIRLIVWRGALDIFRHYPLFGSGVETFAYSYYEFRPVAHNLVSEWDFLYNKAHNEFLNYLSTTGILGFGTYLSLIVMFTIWSVRKIFSKQSGYENKLFILAILASSLAYHIQNFFGFSVVIIATFFYLFPALAFVQNDSIQTFSISGLTNWRIPKALIVLVQLITVMVSSVLILNLGLMWKADTLFALGEKNSENNHPGLAYQELAQATTLNKFEPYYNSELGFSAAEAALALKDTDTTLSGQLKNEALDQTQQALGISPKNVSFWRTAIRTYYILTDLDPSYTQKTLDTIDHAITLAPTDPKLYYNKAVILGTINQNDQAIQTLQKALELKPNYRDAYFALSLFYFDQKKTKEAVDTMNKVLQLVPNDAEAITQLVTWGKQGVATTSSEQK